MKISADAEKKWNKIITFYKMEIDVPWEMSYVYKATRAVARAQNWSANFRSHASPAVGGMLFLPAAPLDLP